jgi:hypothetical protein
MGGIDSQEELGAIRAALDRLAEQRLRVGFSPMETDRYERLSAREVELLDELGIRPASGRREGWAVAS